MHEAKHSFPHVSKLSDLYEFHMLRLNGEGGTSHHHSMARSKHASASLMLAQRKPG